MPDSKTEGLYLVLLTFSGSRCTPPPTATTRPVVRVNIRRWCLQGLSRRPLPVSTTLRLIHVLLRRPSTRTPLSIHTCLLSHPPSSDSPFFCKTDESSSSFPFSWLTKVLFHSLRVKYIRLISILDILIQKNSLFYVQSSLYPCVLCVSPKSFLRSDGES